MYGGSAKLRRRVGGGGVGNRSSFPPPSRLSLDRPAAGPQSSSSNINNHRSSELTATSAEENFSLVPGNNPLSFGTIIRLTPELVEEIRRVESEGGSTRIKFDSIGTNPTGNVINVDGKEFKFTWSREFGDLCDIYEECQIGEDGNGLLVESGCAWRKLNVQRVLDESITNHVKMLSEEAERKHKSRKAIVLDHSNPSMKNQLKQIAAVETNPWKNSKQKKVPQIKKRKVDPPLVTAPPKSSYKSGAPSPLVNVGPNDVQPVRAKGKENAVSSKKEFLTKDSNLVRETAEQKRNLGAKPMDMQSLLISLLKECPKGESLKVADSKAPGRCTLKPGQDFDKYKKTSSGSERYFSLLIFFFFS